MNLYLPFVSAYAIPQLKAILLQNLLQSIPLSLLFSYNPHFVGLPHASYSYSTTSVPALSNSPMTAPGKLDAVRFKRRMPGLRGGASVFRKSAIRPDIQRRCGCLPESPPSIRGFRRAERADGDRQGNPRCGFYP